MLCHHSVRCRVIWVPLTATSPDSFDQSLSDREVSGVTTMNYMFRTMKVFNLPVEDWDLFSVTTTSYMPMAAIAFNQPIGDWDTSSVATMSHIPITMLVFNQPMGISELSSFMIMSQMFPNSPLFRRSMAPHLRHLGQRRCIALLQFRRKGCRSLCPSL